MVKCLITDTPDSLDENFIIEQLWRHNATIEPIHLHPLLITLRNDDNAITGGLISRTWWGGLEVQYLWISESYRQQGFGREMMLAAEVEARKRGCHMAYVDTFSFQAQGFYQKLGYREYGEQSGYAHRFTRHYLTKNLLAPEKEE